VDREIVRLKLTDICFDSSDKFSFAVTNRWGKEVRIPYHRIKRVWRRGELIWQRELR